MPKRKIKDASPVINQNRLFIASCLSLVTAAMVFIIRTDIMDPLRLQFDVTYKAIGAAAGLSFTGLAVALFLSGPLCDVVGMGRLLRLAAVLHIAGIALTIYSPSMAILSLSMLTVGLAHGLVEGVINPLCATIYPEEKTNKLNVLHAWWPGGLVIGGLMAVALTQMGASWQVKQAMTFLPAVAYGVMILGLKFPQTERVVSGVSYGAMFKEAIRPGFLLLALCMLLTAATELGPNQWMESVLKETAEMSGTLVLVYISGLMFVLRFFAGWLARQITPIGILYGASVLSAVGLFMLSGATSVVSAYLAATIFAVGICYYWPTMLAVVSERYPKGGAWLICLMGTMGMISIQFVLPIMGDIREAQGAAASFRYVSGAPVLLSVIFAGMLIYYLSIRGYKPVRLRGKD